MLHEELGTPLPWQVQVLDEEAGNNHAHAVMHPPRAQQLADPRINDGIPSTSSTELCKPLLSDCARVDRQCVHLWLQVLPRCFRLVEQHIGVELTPCDFGTEHIRTCGPIKTLQ